MKTITIGEFRLLAKQHGFTTKDLRRRLSRRKPPRGRSWPEYARDLFAEAALDQPLTDKALLALVAKWTGQAPPRKLKPVPIIPGQRYGALRAMEHVGRGLWVCRCVVCLTETNVHSSRLRREPERCTECPRPMKRGAEIGGEQHPLYVAWSSMRRRVRHEPDYIRKGVRICPQWDDEETGYHTFYDDAFTLGWEKGLDMHRVDDNGHYEPGNVAFISRGEHRTAHAWLNRGNVGLPPKVLARMEARAAKLNTQLADVRRQLAAKTVDEMSFPDEKSLPPALQTARGK